MPDIVIRLSPRLLQNPDADLRYLLSDEIIAQGNGLLEDNGYDYATPISEGGSTDLLLFLSTDAPNDAIVIVHKVLATATICGNSDLARATTVTIEPSESLN